MRLETQRRENRTEDEIRRRWWRGGERGVKQDAAALRIGSRERSK
jgi:uncharacterized protein YndB with AHSA1/START domain